MCRKHPFSVITAFLVVLFLGGCQTYTLIDGSSVTVKGACTVAPQTKWSKASRIGFGNPDRTEVWTMDGENLDMAAFFCGVG